MAVDRMWMQQIRTLLAEARPIPQAGGTPSSEPLYPPEEADALPRARLITQINRIALRYGWAEVIVEALGSVRASSLAQLSDDQLDALTAEMFSRADRVMSRCADTNCEIRARQAVG